MCSGIEELRFGIATELEDQRLCLLLLLVVLGSVCRELQQRREEEIAFIVGQLHELDLLVARRIRLQYVPVPSWISAFDGVDVPY